MKLIMRNEPNFRKSQMFITLVLTTNYSEKLKMDTWSKRTQTNPIYSELVEPKRSIRYDSLNCVIAEFVSAS
jgi:hypothetical protein